MQVFHERKQFMKLLLRENQLKRSIMMLMIKGPLPTEAEKLHSLYKDF
jgi:hypothetical protein